MNANSWLLIFKILSFAGAFFILISGIGIWHFKSKNERWLSISTIISFTGAFLVLISNIGTWYYGTGIEQMKDRKIDELVSGNNSLIGKNDSLIYMNNELSKKLDRYQNDLKEKEKQIKQLEIKAQKASQGVFTTYDFNGVRRVTTPGGSKAVAGPETTIFQRMLRLEKEKNIIELAKICKEQIKKTPEWLTPYLFLGSAYANIGKIDSAIQNFKYVLKMAPDHPDYKMASELIKKLKSK